jgi:hypothetical protein
MKKLLALLLLFGIVGCASVAPATKVIEVSHNIEVTSLDNSQIESHVWQTKVVKNYEDLTIGPDADRAEAMSIETGEKFHIGNYPLGFFVGNIHKLEPTLLKNCEKLFKAKCVITRANIGRQRKPGDGESFFTMTARDEEDRVYFKSLENYWESEKRNKEYRERLAELNDQAELEFIMEERQKQITYKQRQEEKKMAVIHALKERCISYGFTGSNNIAACVQREAQHDYEIEQKEYELQLAKQQILVQQNQQQVTPQVPWYLSILEGVAEGIAEGYKQQALIQTMDSRYEKKDIYRYCRPNC